MSCQFLGSAQKLKSNDIELCSLFFIIYYFLFIIYYGNNNKNEFNDNNSNDYMYVCVCRQRYILGVAKAL